MTDSVFMLGAGFNRSVLDDPQAKRAPLALNFLRVLFEDRLPSEVIATEIFAGTLLAEIERFWKLSPSDLKRANFDIEECLTLFEELKVDSATPPDRAIQLDQASFALRRLLVKTLAQLTPINSTEGMRLFGGDVLRKSADVLTFNYDVVAERCLQLSSGFGPRDGIAASHHAWVQPLAYGLTFDLVDRPVPGVFDTVEGATYYSDPGNQLYANTRVLKLHGSINWLKYSSADSYSMYAGTKTPSGETPEGLFLQTAVDYDEGYRLERSGRPLEPLIIPPVLRKEFKGPLKDVWTKARQSLSECSHLFAIGYSLPPTDFPVRQLLLEAFQDNELARLVVVNPDRTLASDGSVALDKQFKRLTHFRGDVEHYDSLLDFYTRGVS